jgi:hypothetical protein
MPADTVRVVRGWVTADVVGRVHGEPGTLGR